VLQERIAGPLNLPLADAAHGIYTVAAATMTRAVKAVTTYRGRDPRDFTLVAFGGNGPIAAAAVAAALSIRKVLVPPAPGVFSAVGLLLADVEHEFTSSVLVSASDMSAAEFTRVFAELEARARATMQEEGHPNDRIRLKRVAELRYSGQAYELPVAVRPEDQYPDVLTHFHEEHFRTYGHRSDGDPVDFVSIRIFARVEPLEALMGYGRLAALAARAGQLQPHGLRRAYFGKSVGFADTPVISRAALGADWRCGPLIIEEYDSTCVVPPGARVRIDALSSIEIEIPVEGTA
jgi:N-methylhydantoinase A